MHILVIVVVVMSVTDVSMHMRVVVTKIAKHRQSNIINESESIVRVSVISLKVNESIIEISGSAVRASENSKLLIFIAVSKTQ